MSGDLNELAGRTATRLVRWWASFPRKLLDLRVVLCFAGMCGFLVGCSEKVRQPSAEELAEFGITPPSGPSVDMDRIVEARIPTGPYRVVLGDILQLEMPRILDPQSAGGMAVADGNQTYNCRVNDAGMIVLPIIGPLTVAGHSLTEIESSIMAEYYPKYVKTPFPVYVNVIEYSTRRVSIVGAVARPGIYALRHDQMSLVALLMEAGGIADQGAALIEITRTSRMDQDLPTVGVSPTVRDREMDSERKQVVHVASLEPASDGSHVGADEVEARAVFDWEGPLNTAGWLTFENGGSARIRKYADLGSELQRLAFLGAVAAGSRYVPIDELNARLIELARHLEARLPNREASLRAEVKGWETTDGRHFEASLSDVIKRETRSAYENRTGKKWAAEDVMRLTLPVKGLNIPFADAALQEGDSVVVESPMEQFVSVIGLVNRPGNMPYTPDAQYSVIQAIAFAGGLDLVADPRYVRVYRLQPDGEVAGVTLQLVNPKNQEQLTQTLALPVRPGDVVSVEHSLRTRTNVFFDRIFRISFGLYLRPEEFFGNG